MPKTKTTIKKIVKKKPAAPKRSKPSAKGEARFEERHPEEKREHYFEALGKRKTSAARVRIVTEGDKGISVNSKPYQAYFPSLELQETILAPLKLMSCLDQFKILIKVAGGGIHSQAEAVRHGIARALILFNADFRKRLKKAGFLTRDSRMRERKKFGLKRARRAPQWRKR